MSSRLLLALALLSSPVSNAGAAGGKLVLVPFEGRYSAASQETVMHSVILSLAFKGYEVVGGQAVEQFLFDRRIRYLDSLPTTAVIDLAREMGADGVIMGSILSYGNDPMASVAMSARLVSAGGELVWISSVGKSLDAPQADATRPPPRNLLERACASLLSTLPASVAAPRAPPPPARFDSTVRTYRARGLSSTPRKICLIPFRNLSRSQPAARVAEVIFARAFSQHPIFQVVEPADLRRAFVDEGIFSPQYLTPASFKKLSERVGGCAFLMGDLFEYGDASEAIGQTPAVEIFAYLYDSLAGRMLWAVLHRRRGVESEHVLGLGALQTRYEVAEKVIDDLVDGIFAEELPAIPGSSGG